MERALVKINDKTIIGDDNSYAEDYDFVSYRVAHKIQDTLAGAKVSKINISDLFASSEATSQVLRLLDDLEFADDGLKELIFYDWRNMEERLPDGSLLQIADKCQNLQKLQVSWM